MSCYLPFHVGEGREALPAHHLVKLLLHAALYMRVFNHQVDSCSEGARGGFHSGKEHVKDEALQLVHWNGEKNGFADHATFGGLVGWLVPRQMGIINHLHY